MLILLTGALLAAMPDSSRVGLSASAEIVGRRDACARHYANGDGTFTAIITAGSSLDQEAELWPDAADWWTGFVQNDRLNGTYGRADNMIKLEYLYTMNIEDKIRSGWMKFNTSSIPDGSVVTRASLRYLVSYFEMTVYFAVSRLTLDPVPADPQELFDAIADGDVCAEREIGRIYDTTDLNSTGAAHVQNTLGQDWVAFGLYGTNFRGVISRKAWILGWNTTPPSDRPQLAITYEPPQSIEEKPPDETRRTNAVPSVVRGVLELEVGSKQYTACRAALLDISGRKVLDLKPGANDVSRLAPGVYFVQGRGARGEGRAAKIILTK
jgi:hypothetical protein